MKKKDILVIGRDKEILETVIRLVNKNEKWNATGAQSDEEAIEIFHRQHTDIVLLTNGITEEQELKLRKIFTVQQPDNIIIQHYGGGSGLLTNEIQQALEKQAGVKKYSFSVNDDVFGSTNS